MLEDFKKEICEANLKLVEHNLVIFTWGNVSGKSDDGHIVIKPSGVEYDKLTPEKMVVLDLDGNVVEGEYKPSSDTPTHLELYKAFPQIKGVCHTHSTYATSFAQAGVDIVPLGTTHADYFNGAVPCTRILTQQETEIDYEKNTGKVILERFIDLDCLATPGTLVRAHGVFSWGKTAAESVHNAVVIEELSKMSYQTFMINPNVTLLPEYILQKHYCRKHGKSAYYGQR